MKYPKEFRATIAKVTALGWRLEQGKKHPALVSPDGQRRVVFSSTTSGGRSLANFKRDLRKEGVDV